MNDQTVAPPYPRELELRYPKVGATNPTVTFHLLQMSSVLDSTSPDVQEIKFDTFEPNNLVLGEVAWVTDTHGGVLFRTMNRVQDQEKLVLVDVETRTTSVVRERDGTDGWIDNNLAIKCEWPVLHVYFPSI
jgi:dipeptidyl-peptidase-4